MPHPDPPGSFAVARSLLGHEQAFGQPFSRPLPLRSRNRRRSGCGLARELRSGLGGCITARYDDYKNLGSMALVADKPSKSCGAASLRLTAGGSTASADDATDLYKKLLKPNGSGYDELYVRWYVKYQAGAPWHHTGVWLGGYNPPSNWPNPQAGTKPVGDDRVSFGMEPVWGASPNLRFDFYDYWMKMHTCSSCGGAD